MKIDVRDQVTPGPTRDLNKWTLTDGTAKPERHKGKTYPDFKEQMIKELRIMGLQAYYANLVGIDFADDLYRGYCDKNTVQEWAPVMFAIAVQKYPKCRVTDFGPVMV